MEGNDNRIEDNSNTIFISSSMYKISYEGPLFYLLKYFAEVVHDKKYLVMFQVF